LLTYSIKNKFEKLNDKAALKLYRKRMRELGKTEDNINNQISLVFPVDGGFVERFNKLVDKIDEKWLYDSILISGSSVGSELYVAYKMGFKKIYGTEIRELFEDIVKLRLKNYTNIQHTTVNDESLPFDSEFFSVVMSGHIIEHTRRPKVYLLELLRVLKRGGLLYLEYPDRYNDIELHTNTKSYENYPLFVRNCILSILSSPLNKNINTRKMYKSVRDTLMPISFMNITKWLEQESVYFEIVFEETPYKGVERKILRKL
jgi:SAM-dependent methyltransferase